MRIAPALLLAVAGATLGATAVAQEAGPGPDDAGSAGEAEAGATEASADAAADDAPDGAEEAVQDKPLRFGAEQTFELATGIRVVVLAPANWSAKPAEIAVPDLDQVDGAEIKVSSAWSGPHGGPGSIFLVCASAPSKEWAHGMESLVFERMTGIANTELARHMTVNSFASSATVENEHGFQQDFHAAAEAVVARKHGSDRVLEAEDGSGPRPTSLTVVGRHSLSFSGKETEPRALTCSLACTEPTDRAGMVCGAALAAHRIEGATGPEPIPTLPARFASGFARRPIAMAGVALGLLSLLLGVVAIARGLLLSARDASA